MLRNKKLIFWLYVLILLALVLPPHVIGIDRFAEIDEPMWVARGSNFYYALTHGDFENTFYEYHPGVTTTWIVAAGMMAVFPEYRGLGQGYFDGRKFNLEEFLISHNVQPLDLVRSSRIIQQAVLIMLALLLFFLLQLIVEPLLALLAVVLAFDAPVFLGYSRLLNNEAMLAMFVMLSIVSMVVYLNTRRRLVYLLISGGTFGLAQLTKSPSIVVIGIAGLMLLVPLFKRSDSEPLARRLLAAARTLFVWLLCAAVVYVVLWPGMWVAPGKMLYGVYGNAFSYAFQGARLDVTQELEPATFSLDTGFAGGIAYLVQLVLRTTPLTWIGFLLAIPMIFSREIKPAIKGLVAYLFLTALLFVFLFGVAQGRDAAHYVLSSFFAVDVIAAMGCGYALLYLAGRWPGLKDIRFGLAVTVALLLAQLASGLHFFPYYYTYVNPVLASSPANKPIGYGEGLDVAASYLAGKQDANGLRAFVYDGHGCFSYFFPGRVRVMKTAYFWEPGLPDVIAGLRWSEYVVVYSVTQENMPEYRPLLSALEDVKPEHVVVIDGVEYARIYRTADIPAEVYAELGK